MMQEKKDNVASLLLMEQTLEFLSLLHSTLSGFPTNSRDLGCVMKLEYASTLGGLCGGMAHTLVGHGQTSISAEIGS